MRWSIEYNQSVTSTNDKARKLVLAGAAEGTVVTADEQTAGRGSRGRKWSSPPGVNLYASLVLYPELSAPETVELSFVAAVAVADTLRSLGLDARIKWPNDVLVDGRKICGILIETVWRVGENPAAIVGIGINVNWKDFDEEVAETATSVAVELGREIPVREVLDRLLEEFGRLYELFLEQGLAPVMERWRELGWTIGRDVRIAVEERVVNGKAIGVDDHGSLLVETASGLVTVTAAGTLMPEENGGALL